MLVLGDIINLSSGTYDSDGSPVSIIGKSFVIRNSSNFNPTTLNDNDQSTVFLVYPRSLPTFSILKFC